MSGPSCVEARDSDRRPDPFTTKILYKKHPISCSDMHLDGPINHHVTGNVDPSKAIHQPLLDE